MALPWDFKACRDGQKIKPHLRAAFIRSHSTCGSPRLVVELREREGMRTSQKRVLRLMKDCGFQVRPTRRRSRRTTNSNHSQPISSNLLKRDFSPAAPNIAWVTDITYIPTRERWLYLVTILDLFSRQVVGWETSETLGPAFCRKALRHALMIRQPPKNLIVHSDRGVQYAGAAFRQALKERGAISSMSRKGECLDNAVAESFWSTLKAESIELIALDTRALARAVIKRYIDEFYNPVRRHSHLDWRSSMEFERQTQGTVQIL